MTPPKRYTERGVGGWGTLTQNSPPRSVSRVVDGLSRLPSPHLKFSVPDEVEDVDRPLPQLRAPRGSVPSHRTHRGSQDPEPALPPPPQPLLLRLPHAAPSPPITASLWAPRRIPARDCCSQLAALLQPVSWFRSFALCFGQSPFPPLPHPRHGTAPGSGPRGGRAQWVTGGAPSSDGR